MAGDSNKTVAIFIEAIENHRPDEWTRYVDQACQEDPSLRERVWTLLRAHQVKDKWLDKMAAKRPERDGDGQGHKLGQLIGPYRLLKEIGEGGMGLVFIAEQEHPVRRKVALKIIKPGMATRDVLAR